MNMAVETSRSFPSLPLFNSIQFRKEKPPSDPRVARHIPANLSTSNRKRNTPRNLSQGERRKGTRVSRTFRLPCLRHPSRVPIQLLAGIRQASLIPSLLVKTRTPSDCRQTRLIEARTSGNTRSLGIGNRRCRNAKADCTFTLTHPC